MELHERSRRRICRGTRRAQAIRSPSSRTGSTWRSSESSARSSPTPAATRGLQRPGRHRHHGAPGRGARALARRPRTPRRRRSQDDILGHGPLEPLLADEPSPRSWSTVRTTSGSSARAGSPRRLRFNDESHLRRIINKIVGQVGRRIDESSPMVDARLPDGSRVNAIIPPLSLSGPLVTIRRFHHKRLRARRPRRASARSPRRPPSSSRAASRPSSTSSSRAAPAPARRRC